MVQLLPQVPGFGERLGATLEKVGGAALDAFTKRHTKRQDEGIFRQLENPNLSPLQKISMISKLSPESQKTYTTVYADMIKNKENIEENAVAAENYNNIKNLYGENVANAWKALGPGGQTQLIKGATEAAQRNVDINKFLFPGQGNLANPSEQAQEQGQRNGFEQPSSPEQEEPEEPETEESEERFPEVKLSNEGLTKGQEALQATTRKENLPIFQEANTKLRAIKNEASHLKILKNLSPKVPDGLGRVFINKEGQIRSFAQILKLVPPEAEQFVKTVNDFISGAKDFFGARVTNFDLQTFQSRLPTLINSKAGREKIIEQMNIFNEIESNYLNELKDIYSHYGLGKISQEQAEAIATKNTAKREAELRAKLVEDLEQPASKKQSLEEIFK